MRGINEVEFWSKGFIHQCLCQSNPGIQLSDQSVVFLSLLFGVQQKINFGQEMPQLS